MLYPALARPADDAARQEADRRRSVALHFGGQPRGAAVDAALAPLPEPIAPAVVAPAPAGNAPAPGKKKKEGC